MWLCWDLYNEHVSDCYEYFTKIYDSLFRQLIPYSPNQKRLKKEAKWMALNVLKKKWGLVSIENNQDSGKVTKIQADMQKA